MYAAFFELSEGKGPTLTQRLFLRLLLRGTSWDDFVEGHVPFKGHASDSNQLSTSTRGSDCSKHANAGLGGPRWCTCIGSASFDLGVQEYLQSVDTFAELLHRSASALRAKHLAVEGTFGSNFHPLATTLQCMPPERIASLLRRLSANVYSITSGGGFVWSSRVDACECLDHGREVAIGLYGPPISRFNHSCAPNAIFGFGNALNSPGVPVQMSVVASRPIAQGEEICVAYTNPFQMRAIRRKNLARGYGFNCTCPLCCCCSTRITDRVQYFQAVSGQGNPKDDPIDAETGNVCPQVDCCHAPFFDKAAKRCSFAPSAVESALPANVCFPWAFDLQMNGVFCPQDACVKDRQSKVADVRACLEMNYKRLLMVRSAGRCSGHAGVEQHCVDDSSSPLVRSESQFLLTTLRVRPSVLFAKFPTTGEWRPIELSEENGHTAGTLTKVVLGEVVDVTCLSCRTVCETSMLKKFQAHLHKLMEVTRTIEARASDIHAEPPNADLEEDATRAATLFSTVQMFLHPGNSTLYELCLRLNCVLQPIPRLYVPLGLATSQHLVLAAGAAYGSDSTQRADKLIIIGKMLLFLAQEDRTALKTSVWDTLKTISVSGLAVFDGKAGSSGDQDGSSSCSDVQIRKQLLAVAKKCFVDACSILYALACSENERRQGRVAEECLAACSRESHLLESLE